MKNCASRLEPTQAFCHHSSMRPRALAMALKEGSRSLLLRLILLPAGKRLQRSLFRHRAHGKQWSICGEDRIFDADHTHLSASPHPATASPAPAPRGCGSGFRPTRMRRPLPVRLQPRHPNPQSRGRPRLEQAGISFKDETAATPRAAGRASIPSAEPSAPRKRPRA